MVAHNPLHRSGRAALPHPAPALGDDAEANEWVRMPDADGRQPPVDVSAHPVPGYGVPSAAATQDLPPQPPHSLTEGAESGAVHGHAVIAAVTENDRSQIGALLRDGTMQASAQLDFDLLQLGLPPRTHRLPQHREATRPLPRATVREAEEVEGLGLPVAPPSSILVGKLAKLDEARLAGMQLQAEPAEPLAQLGQDPLGILAMLESHDEVIGKPHDDGVAVGLRLPPPLDPEVEHIVQVEVGQQRADAPALDRTGVGRCSPPILQHAGPQPFLDEAHDAPVRHAVLEKLHQPAVVEGIEEPTDVGIEHPVHPLRQEPDRERVQSRMRAAPRSESVGKAEEVDLVDRVEHLDDGTLDDLILQRGNAERSHPPVRLRDVRSTHRLRPVRSPLQPAGEVLEVAVEILSVVPPRLAIDTGSRLPLEGEVGCPQPLDGVHVVKERGEPLLPILPRSLTYSLERAERTVPALRPERVTLGRVPLGQPPSLRCLRGRFLGLVQQLPRYYGSVRLPASAHHRRVSLDFPMRPSSPLLAGGRGISRFPCAVRPGMHGVSDRAGSGRPSRSRGVRCGLPLLLTASAPRSTRGRNHGGSISRLNTRPALSPVNASPSPLRATTHDSGPVWVATPSPYDSFIRYTAPV